MERLRDSPFTTGQSQVGSREGNIEEAGKAFRLTDSADKIIEFNGRLIARWRTGPALKAMLLTHAQKTHRVQSGLIMLLDVARIGQRVAVVGRRVGDKKHEANDGQTRTVGRILAEVVVP